MTRHAKDPTCTSLVEAVLVVADDFKTVRQLAAETRCTFDQVGAALHHMLRHQAVSFISDASGTWWYATPQTDNRIRVVAQRTIETAPRKPRKPRKVVPK